MHLIKRARRKLHYVDKAMVFRALIDLVADASLRDQVIDEGGPPWRRRA